VLLACLAAGSSGETCPHPAVGNFVSYVVAPEVAGSSLALKVDLTFQLDNHASIDLVLPSEWEGAKELYKQVSDIRVLSPGTSVRDSPDPSRPRLSFERGKPVHVEYKFARAEPAQAPQSVFGAVLNSKFFVLTGRNFLVYPDIPEHEPIGVSFEWKGFPADWTLADSLAANQSCQGTGSLLALSNGLFIGGDFRLEKRLVEGQPIYIAVRGEWPFSDGNFADKAANILSVERDFWSDRSAPYYLVALVPIDAPAGEYAGTAVEGGFLMLMSPGTPLGSDVEFLLAHEMFHTWNPAQLGEVGADNPVYWFSEGFTDYYARLLLLRSSLITPDEYVKEINLAYAEYMASAARNYGEKVVQAQYFDYTSAQRLPYLQGSLLALKWNALIGEHGAKRQSLDDAMRALRRKAETSEQILTDGSLGTFLAAFAGPQTDADIRNYIVLGQTIPLPPNGLGGCTSLTKKTFYKFESGFDIEALYRDGRIRGMKVDSEAYKAGLRDGQTVVRSTAIDPNDPDRAIDMTVFDSGMPKKIHYLPHGSQSEIDQYELKAQDKSQQCLDALSH
jgi:predicted metalloprotease with PDZ domain